MSCDRSLLGDTAARVETIAAVLAARLLRGGPALLEDELAALIPLAERVSRDLKHMYDERPFD
jgi:hypothetical protein